MCRGTTPETFDIEISTNSDEVLNIEQCSFSNGSHTSCGKFTSYMHSEGEQLTLALNLSNYLQLNEHYVGNIGMHNIAGSANTSMDIRE